ncbi:MAG: hypothetical protein ACI9JK_000095 [Phycisphaerales bacterium]|jgi:hypothetical protein
MLATKPKIAIVVSSPMTAWVFLRDQLNNLVDTRDVTLLVNFEQKETKYDWLDERVTVGVIRDFLVRYRIRYLKKQLIWFQMR